MVLSGVCFVLMLARYEVEVGPIFFFRSLSLHFSKPKISSYLRVFVIELPFLLVGIWDDVFFRCHCDVCFRRAKR